MREAIDEALTIASLALRDGYTRTAANRAYYAMFYAAQLYLRERAADEVGDSKTHAGTRRQFDRFAIKRDGLDRSLSTALAQVEELRLTSDYELARPDPTTEVAGHALKTAEWFVRTVLAALDDPR